METKTPAVKLDWSRLVGFELADRNAADRTIAPRLNDARLAKLGAKFGGKPGMRLRSSGR